MKDLAVCLLLEYNATTDERVIAVINMHTYAHNYKFSMCLLCYT